MRKAASADRRKNGLLERFDQLADHTGAVGRLRELIISFAVQGRLVPQVPDDEEASTCLARLGLKTPAATEDSIEADSSPLLPSWDRVRFEDVAVIAGGVTLGRKVTGKKMVSFPYLRVANVKRGEIDLSVIKEVTIAEDEIERYALRENDLLMTEGGDWDKVGRAAIWKGQISPCLHQNHIFRARMRSDALLPRWFEGYFNSPVGRSYFESASKQTTNLASINMRQVRACPIPFPPLTEQKRIVAKVDELMALCDRLEAQLQKRDTWQTALARGALARFADAPTPANLELLFHDSFTITPADLRKTILTLAVQGHLVPQDRRDGDARDLLASISATKAHLQAQGKIGKDKPVGLLDSSSLPFEVPDSWCWARLGEVTELITKGSSPKWQGIAYVSEPEGVLFITSENVGNYRLRKLDELKYVDRCFNEIEPRSILITGDILMNLVGASIGRTAIYDLHVVANINQAVALIRLVRGVEDLDPSFLLHYLNSPFAVEYMLSSRVTSAQPNISLTDAREFAIPIPPLAEQRRIVAKVDQLMALVDQCESQLAAARTTADHLLSALVADLTAA